MLRGLSVVAGFGGLPSRGPLVERGSKGRRFRADRFVSTAIHCPWISSKARSRSIKEQDEYISFLRGKDEGSGYKRPHGQYEMMFLVTNAYNKNRGERMVATYGSFRSSCRSSAAGNRKRERKKDGAVRWYQRTSSKRIKANPLL